MKKKTAKTVSQEVRKFRKARVARHRACWHAYRAAQKKGFKGLGSGEGAWTKIHEFCDAHNIPYPAAKRVRGEAAK